MLEATKILVKAQLVVRLRRTTEARESSLIWDEAGGGTKQGGKNILALQTQTSLHATAGGKKKNTMLLLQGLEEGKNAHLCTSLGIYFSLRFVEMEASKIHKAPVSAQPRYSSAGCLSCPPSLLCSSFGSSCPLLCTTQRNFCHPCPLPPAGSRYQVSHAKACQVCGRYFCLRDAIRQLLQSTETPPNGCSVLIF